MRRTLITALAVLIIAIALCVASTWAVGGAVKRADDLRLSAEHAAKLGDRAGALKQVLAMSESWQSDNRWLELMTSHDALSDVRVAIDDARVCLENNERAEFLRACAVMAAALERLRATESVRLMNLF